MLSLHCFASLVENTLRKSDPLKRRKADRNRYLLEALEPVLFADQGLLAYFFFDAGLTVPLSYRLDSVVNFDWDPSSTNPAFPSGTVGVRWTGQFIFPDDFREYNLHLTSSGGVRLILNGETVIDRWSGVAQPSASAGDMDNDGDLDSDDLDPFMDALNSIDEEDFLTRYPNAIYSRADMNSDGFADGQDWDPFISRLNYGVVTTTDSYQATYFAGQTVSFELDFFGGGGQEHIDLSWDDNKGDVSGGVPPTQFVLPKSTALISGTVTGTEGSQTTLHASFTDPVGSGLSASVDWGDDPTHGTIDTNVPLAYSTLHSGTLAASHTYTVDGDFNATLKLSGPTGTQTIPFSVHVSLAKPTSLDATAPGAGRVDLSWINHSNSQAGFNIYISTNSGLTYDYFDKVSGSVTSYSATGLSANTAYSFKVTAFNDRRESALSDAKSVTTPFITIGNGSTPVATPDTSDLTVADLAWGATLGATGYAIEWSIDGGATPFKSLASIDGDQTNYQAKGLTRGTDYTFRVTAYTPVGSGTSQTFSLTTIPRIPTDLTAALMDDQAVLSWSAVKGAISYGLERTSDLSGSTGWMPVSLATGNDGVSQVDPAAPSDQSVLYRLKSTNAAGSSDYSATVKYSPIPNAPVMGQLDASHHDGKLVLTWNANSETTNETGFYVYRSEDGTNFTKVGTLPAGLEQGAGRAMKYETTLGSGDAGKLYSYRVTAYNDAGESEVSQSCSTYVTPPMSELSGTLFLTINQPVSTTGTIVADASYQASFSGYTDILLQRAPVTAAGIGTFADVYDFGPSGTSIFTPLGFNDMYHASYSDSPGPANTSYCYRLKGTTPWGDTCYSNTAGAMLSVPGQNPGPLDTPGTTSAAISVTGTYDFRLDSPALMTVKRTTGSANQYPLYVVVKHGSSSSESVTLAIPAGEDSVFFPVTDSGLASVPWSITRAYYQMTTGELNVSVAVPSANVSRVDSRPLAYVDNISVEAWPWSSGTINYGRDQSMENPARNIVLTNNNYDMDPQVRDYDQSSVDTYNDFDLVQLNVNATNNELGRNPSTKNGTYSIAVSDLTSIRLFMNNGAPLTQWSVGTTSPTGYLHDLATDGFASLWVEGLKANPDVTITISYTDTASGHVTARTVIHMAIVDMSFQSSAGSTIESAPVISTSSAIAQSQGRSGSESRTSGAFVPVLSGLPTGVPGVVTVPGLSGSRAGVPFNTGAAVGYGGDFLALGNDNTVTDAAAAAVRAALGLRPLRSDQLTFTYTAFPGESGAQVFTRTFKAGPNLIAVDGNRDGTVSLDGSDDTSPSSPYKFWINDNVDHLDPAGNSDNEGIEDYDELNPLGQTLDWQTGKINNARDLEDFSRIRIQPPVGFDPADPSWSMTLGVISYDGMSVNVFTASKAQADGYVTDSAIAPQLVGTFGKGEISENSSWTVTSNYFATHAASDGAIDLLFEGCKPGTGLLAVTFTKGATEVADAVALDLQPARLMYETYSIGDAWKSNAWNSAPSTIAATTASLVRGSPYESNDITTNDYVLLVHGWRMQGWEKTMFADTAFKRLFWQGYQGKFGAFDWPTEWMDITLPWALLNEAKDLGSVTGNYDRSEEKAWYSATPLYKLLNSLDTRVGGYTHVNLLAHSMGNIVASQALKMAGNQKVVHTYVASQAATAAEAYDGIVHTNMYANPIYSLFAPGAGVPDIYANYFGTINQAADGIYNFFNPTDYATFSSLKTWRTNQAMKPDPSYAATPSGYYQRYLIDGDPVGLRPIGPFQAFAYAAKPLSIALGAQGGVGGSITDNLDLSAPSLGFTAAPNDHSAQFLNTNASRRGYWDAFLTKADISHWSNGS